MKTIKKSIITLGAVSAIVLTGCSGATSDAAIGNVSYECAGITGFTNSKGEFTCPIGSSVTFYYGNIELGSITKLPSDKIILIQDALHLDRSEVTNPIVTKLAVFLQSLDNDGDDSNGIFLDPKLIQNLVTTKQNFTDIDDTQVTHIIDTVVNANASGKMRKVTREQAQSNLRVGKSHEIQNFP